MGCPARLARPAPGMDRRTGLQHGKDARAPVLIESAVGDTIVRSMRAGWTQPVPSDPVLLEAD